MNPWIGIQDAMAAARALRIAHENGRLDKGLIRVYQHILRGARDNQRKAFLTALETELPGALQYFDDEVVVP